MACEDHDFAEFLASSTALGAHLSHVRPLSLATILIHGPFWALLYIVASRFALHSFDALAIVLGLRMLMATVMIGKVLKRPQSLARCVSHSLQGSGHDRNLFRESHRQVRSNGAGASFRLLPGGVMRELA